MDLSDGHLHILLRRYQNLLWQVILGQVPSLQFATTLHFLQVYVASGYSKFTTVDYLGVLGIGDHVWWLTFKRINLNAAVLVYNSDPHKGVVSLM